MGSEVVVISYDSVQSVLAQSGAVVVGNLVYGVAAFCVMVLILAIGYAVAWAVGKAIKEFARQIKVENFMEKHGVHDSLLGFNITSIAVILAELWIMAVFLGIATQITGVGFLLGIGMGAASYIENLATGTVILVAGLIAGDYVTDKMKTMKKIPFVNGIAMAVEVLIIYVAATMALPHMLPVSTDMLQTAFYIVLASVCFSVGIGFAIATGLGLKDAVAEVAKKNKDKIAKVF